MKSRNYKVHITKQEDGGYMANIPSLQHCFSFGETIEEAIEHVREALEGVLMVMEEKGLPIPDDNDVIEASITISESSSKNRLSNLVSA
ncbi:type II toxin-antitoxin system HicB family antitoxin [Emticicia sp. 21SJ11W-3]|uniref:type II toxin-antitoxin system HicB family antitoxin n=1 Tax=Emticicia sp. 21SJ11W-3 TaxID=2916755 RepID=UPI00209E36B1|nr:type II toxin-antitoxin system HicB family antitoxin [Emticicia sp. 21SJ11W-3]UTA66789.1 type II toxin-antitoxin system HicB family antitoxin [Emticicia sp. 21SJ11W-3]